MSCTSRAPSNRAPASPGSRRPSPRSSPAWVGTRASEGLERSPELHAHRPRRSGHGALDRFADLEHVVVPEGVLSALSFDASDPIAALGLDVDAADRIAAFEGRDHDAGRELTGLILLALQPRGFAGGDVDD